jgi:tRNA splicing ligase
MRTLYEIIEDVKDNKKPDYEEIRYVLLVYNFLFNIDHRNLRKELLAEPRSPEFARKLKADNSFNMAKTALNTSPKKYIGGDDPENPEYQKFRKLGNKLIDKIITNQRKEEDLK